MRIRTPISYGHLMVASFALVAGCFCVGAMGVGIFLIGLVSGVVIAPGNNCRFNFKRIARGIDSVAKDEASTVNSNDVAADTESLSSMTDELKQSRNKTLSCNKLVQTFDSISDSLVVVSFDGTIKLMNRAARDMYGSEQPFARMIERMPGQAVIDLHSVLRGDQPKLETTYSFQSVGLQTLWLRMSVNSLCNSGGEAVILHSDITAFMLFSEKQQKSLALLEGICNQVPGMLYQYRTFADGRHSIPYVNQKITEILGVTPEEALSDAGVVFALIHPEDCNVLGVSLREAAQNRTPWQREFRVVLPDQRWRWLQAESTMEQLDDGGLLWHGFAKDISEQKLLEQELRKAQEDLESQVLERTAKLSVANGKLAKLNEDVLAEIKERLKLERKLRESRDQMVLLAAELNLSEERERRRIATALHDDVVQDLALGKLRLDMTLKEDKPSPVLLEALIALMGKAIQQIRDICHDLSPPLLYDLGLPQAIESLGERLAREHQLGFTLRGKLHAVSLPDHVRTVLYQTARELLINVVKHAKAKHVVVHIRHKHGTVQLSVIDDGVGFAPSMGKGFGLSHVEQRIEFLQGSVRVISGPGRKTVIAVAVPIKPSWRPPS